MESQLWAYDPSSNDHQVLPQPQQWRASFALSDLGSLSLTYPIGAPGLDALTPTCHVEVRYKDASGAWKCPPQGRFRGYTISRDPVQERVHATRSYSMQSYATLARFALQQQTSNLNDQGERSFPNQSPGQVAGTLISELKAGGGAPHLTYQNNSGTGGSSPALAVGKSALDVLTNAVSTGQLEWLVVPDSSGQGRKLVAYKTVGTDRSTGDNPVILRDGIDLDSAPSDIATGDMAAKVIVQGDSGRYVTLTNPGAQIPDGILPVFVTAGGLSDVASLEVVAQATLDKGAKPRMQHTRSIRFERAKFLPFIDYSLGDTILAPDEDGDLAAMRILEIALAFDQSGLTGVLTLGDRFATRIVRNEQIIAKLTGGAAAVSGSGSAPSKPADDKRKPAAPTGFNVGSEPYTDVDGSYKAIGIFGWVNPSTATDGSAMDPAGVQLFGRRGTSGTFRKVTDADFPATSLDWSPFDAGVTYQFKLRAVSANGKVGPFSAVKQIKMAKDTEPPPVPLPAQVDSQGGTLEVRVTALGVGNVPMPADYDFTEVHISSQAGFTADGNNIRGTCGAPGIVTWSGLDYDTTYYVKLIAVDRAGNKSAASEQVSAVIKKVVAIDLDTGSVTSDALTEDLKSQISATGNYITRSTSNPSGTAKENDTWEKWSTLGLNGKLLAFWRWHSGSWVKGVIDPTYLPKVDIGQGTFGSLLGSRLVALSVGADELAADSVIAGKVKVGALDGFELTGSVIQTAKTGPKVQMTSNLFRMSVGDDWDDWRVLFNPSSNYFGFRSGTGGTRIVFDSTGLTLSDGARTTVQFNANDGSATLRGPVIAESFNIYSSTNTGVSRINLTDQGLRLYRGSNRVFFLDSSDGSIQMDGPLVTGGTFTSPLIRTSASGARIELTDTTLQMLNGAGDWLFKVTSAGYLGLRTKAGNGGLLIDPNGLTLEDSTGKNTVRFDASDGSATLSGAVIANSFNIYSSANTGASRINLTDQGLRLYKGSTRTMFLDAATGDITMTGALMTSGTISASNVNTPRINGATFSGTQSGGTFSGMTQSGGSWSGSIANNGITYGGQFRSSNSGTRVQVRNSNKFEVLYGGSVVGYINTDAAGAGLTIRGNTNANGVFIGSGTGADAFQVFAAHVDSPMIRSNELPLSSGTMMITSGGTMGVFTSSAKHKLDMQPLALDPAFLDIQPTSWEPKPSALSIKESLITPWKRRQGGFIVEQMHDAGFTAGVVYDRLGRPNAPDLPGILAQTVAHMQSLVGEVTELKSKVAALEAA